LVIEVVIALGTWFTLRRSQAPSLARWARFLTLFGAVLTVAPVTAIAPEVVAGNPSVNPAVAVTYMLVVGAALLLLWFWLGARSRRGEAAFVAAAAVGGIAAAAQVYPAMFGGDVDAQNGIVLLIVGLRQLAVVVVLAMARALWRKRSVP
jgi:hypothetical protein